MRVSDVIKAKIEASRFLAAVSDLEQDHETWKTECGEMYGGGKRTAAVKRSSMDLSAALVELRKSPWRK